MEIKEKAIRLGTVAVGVCSVERLIKANAVDMMYCHLPRQFWLLPAVTAVLP